MAALDVAFISADSVVLLLSMHGAAPPPAWSVPLPPSWVFPERVARATRERVLETVKAARDEAWSLIAKVSASRDDRMEVLGAAHVLEALEKSLSARSPRAGAALLAGARKASLALGESMSADLGVLPMADLDMREVVYNHITASSASKYGPGGRVQRLVEILTGVAMVQDPITLLNAIGLEGPGDRRASFEADADALWPIVQRYANTPEQDRVVVPRDVPHRAGASPRKRQALCRCAKCVANRIVSDVEEALASGVRLTPPKKRGRRAAK